MSRMSCFRFTRSVVVAALLSAGLAACAAPVSPIAQRPVEPAPPLDIDRNMSCEALAASFHDAAVRAARLEDWIEAGPIASYGPDPFFAEVPERLAFERKRLDGLTVIQREKGCPFIDPVAAVAAERRHHLPDTGQPGAPSVLRRLG